MIGQTWPALRKVTSLTAGCWPEYNAPINFNLHLIARRRIKTWIIIIILKIRCYVNDFSRITTPPFYKAPPYKDTSANPMPENVIAQNDWQAKVTDWLTLSPAHFKTQGAMWVFILLELFHFCSSGRKSWQKCGLDKQRAGFRDAACPCCSSDLEELLL